MLIEVHILQNHAPSNLNRDDIPIMGKLWPADSIARNTSGAGPIQTAPARSTASAKVRCSTCWG